MHSFLQFLFVSLCLKESKQWFTSYTRRFHGWLVAHSQPGRYSLGGWWRCHANSHNVLRWVASSAKGHTLWMMCQWKMTWLINCWVMVLCINRTVEQSKRKFELMAVIDNFEQYHSTACAFEVNIMISTTLLAKSNGRFFFRIIFPTSVTLRSTVFCSNKLDIRYFSFYK